MPTLNQPVHKLAGRDHDPRLRTSGQILLRRSWDGTLAMRSNDGGGALVREMGKAVLEIFDEA